MNQNIQRLIDKALSETPLSKDDVVTLLSVPDYSEEAFAMRSAAAHGMRSRTNNAAAIFGQIGFEMHPCSANCQFCSFAADYTCLSGVKLTDEEIVAATRNFTGRGDLYGLYLMMMADYRIDEFLEKVALVKANVTGPTKIISNVGDSSVEDFRRMKEAGVDAVYHCWRLGEGEVTPFSAEERKQTMRNAKEAGLDIMDAVEPIGPEHTNEELAEHILFSIELGSIQSGCMKRTPVPGTPFADRGTITDFRLSHIVAVQALANIAARNIPILGIHEYTPMGYISGANMITAETGVNPRDTAEETSQSRGLDIPTCREFMRQCGFTKLMLGDDTLIDL
ncbi:MAG: hypothetical protein IJO87_10015 [Eggerthellaceae bacterium]|nr:hypothetical protein [Eggerthellaceae bacterium]